MRIPTSPLSQEAVLAAVEAARNNDVPWRDGKLYAYTFDGGRAVEEVGKKAFMAYLSENGLDPTTFPSLRKFENDLVDMARRHLGGDENVVGNFTSGGTESIMLALKTARDAFRARHPGAGVPQVILPVTAHAAFHKAAHYLGINVVAAGVDRHTFCADPVDMAGKITDRTMMLVASASSYAHGVVDPVEVIAGLAADRGLFCHVDGCMGGFLLPYFRRLGAPVPDFDFRVRGVTSMSMDFHKYALTPKGASVVLYRNESLRRHQIFACANWTGYTMINNAMQSSKSGGPMAAAWAVLQYVGDTGYLEYARGLLGAKNAIVNGVQQIKGLRVMGDPVMSLVAFTSDELSVFAIADEMKQRGFHVQPQLKLAQHSKENIHVSISPSNVPHTQALLAALRESVAAVRAAGGVPTPPTELAEMLTAQIDADLTGEGLSALVASMTGGSGELPGKMADTNALLNELSLAVREKLLVAFMGNLFTPRAE